MGALRLAVQFFSKNLLCCSNESSTWEDNSKKTLCSYMRSGGASLRLWHVLRPICICARKHNLWCFDHGRTYPKVELIRRASQLCGHLVSSAEASGATSLDSLIGGKLSRLPPSERN